MITETPTEKDFTDTAKHFLFSAWDALTNHVIRDALANDHIDLLRHGDKKVIPETEDGSTDDTPTTQDPQEKRARRLQRYLHSSAHAESCLMAFTGVENLLKARIARVSPYLLIVGSPKQWPGGSETKDIPFSAFNSVGASDLVRAYWTVQERKVEHNQRLDTLFSDFRVERNRITHSHQIHADARQILTWMLELVHLICGDGTWLRWRRAGLEAVDDGADDWWSWTWQLNAELSAASYALDTAHARRLLGAAFKDRKYMCPFCLDHMPRLLAKSDLSHVGNAVVQGDKVSCPTCETISPVRCEKCPVNGCPGSWFSTTNWFGEVCLTCGSTLPEADADADAGSS